MLMFEIHIDHANLADAVNSLLFTIPLGYSIEFRTTRLRQKVQIHEPFQPG